MKNAKRVKLVNLNKTFVTSKSSLVTAVDNINLDIEPGEFVCLLGPSGCGKTTTLRMIAGFEIPTSGEVLIGEKNVASLSPDKRNTAMVFQNYALFPHMNVYDNIAYGLKIQKLPKKEINLRVKKILKLMKMEDFADRVPSQMSGGQQQRVSLARALIMESGVLLFDEPLSNLDAKLRLHMRDEIRKLQKEVGITSIYVTHDQAEAMALSDKVVIMENGKIQQVGTPKEIYQKPNSEFIAKFIGRANIIDGIISEIDGDNITVAIHDVPYLIKESNRDYKLQENIKIVIRPESVKIGKNDFIGSVRKSVFMGENHEYEIKLGDKILEISENNPYYKEIYDVGEKIAFAFDEDTMHIL